MKRPKILELLLGVTTCSLFGLGTACAATGNFPADFVSVRRAMIISFEPESLPFGVPPGGFAGYVRNSASAPVGEVVLPEAPYWVTAIDWKNITKVKGLQSIEEVLRDKGNSSPEVVVSSYAAALASQNPQKDFFGYDIRDHRSNAAFREALSALERKGYDSHPLVNDWIHQPNSAIQMAGFLNSFGTTLALADSEVVGSTLPSSKTVNPSRLLEKAYSDMARLISGQVVSIDENRKATKEEERVLIQAATNLGYKKALELDALRGDGSFSEILFESLLSDYNLLNLGSLDRTTLRHNAILLRLSLSAALGRNLSRKDHEIESLFRRKGFAADVLQEVDSFRDHAYKTFAFLQPSNSLEHIISSRFEIYEPALPKEPPIKQVAAQTLQGIETFGIDRGFVYDKLASYGQPAFDALKNPKQFIGSIKNESASYPLTRIRRHYFNSMLNEIEWALLYPLRIHEIEGFGYGSIVRAQNRPGNDEHHDLLTRRTWLSACYDFIVAYRYAQTNDCLAEFYADATPPENAPCLPGKIRAAQEWFESKTMLVDDTACILEKVFAGMAGIELTSAVQQLYRKYVWANLEIYRAENGSIPAEEANKQEAFKKEYLTIQAIKEGLVSMVADNLPTVIRKYRLNRSAGFPIAAFHSHKYAEVRLWDGLGADDHGITNQQEIMQRQAQANRSLLQVVDRIVEILRDQGAIEVYQPAGLMSLGRMGF